MTPLRLQILPTLASFGPLFIVIGLVFTSQNEPASFQTAFRMTFAIAGACITSTALGIIASEILRLRQVLEASRAESR